MTFRQFSQYLWIVRQYYLGILEPVQLAYDGWAFIKRIFV